MFCARGISKLYRVGEIEVHALREVDRDLYPGEFLVLLGPSGSGKSTLFDILGGLDVGETLILHPSDHVRDGIRVAPGNRGRRFEDAYLEEREERKGRPAQARRCRAARSGRGADTVEEIHLAIARMPLEVLAKLDIFERTTKEVRKLQDTSIGAINDLIRKVNHEVAGLAKELLDFARACVNGGCTDLGGERGRFSRCAQPGPWRRRENAD